MLLTSNKSIEDLVCVGLQQGALDKVVLIDRIKKMRPRTTKQGVYVALRNLESNEVVVIHNKKVSLDVRWLKQMNNFFTTAEQSYTGGDFLRGDFLSLKDGEKISYLFSSASETDKFWGHALVVLAESAIPKEEPVYIYNPHEWFLIAREKSEKESFSIITRKRKLLLTVGSRTPLDRAVAKEFDQGSSKYHMMDRPVFPKENYYLNIVGDFMIEVRIDPNTARLIGSIYNSTEKLDEEVKTELIKIVSSKGRSRLTIRRDSKKATELKKVLRKNFHFPVAVKV